MAGEKYADLAVTALKDYVSANLPTYLRQVETDQGLANGSLTDPVAYVKAMVPDDGRAPLVEIWCEGGEPIDHNNNLQSHDCVISLVFTGDADAEAGFIKAYRYMTALVDTIRAGRQLSDKVVVAADGSREFFTDRRSNPSIYAIALNVEVHTYG